MGSVFLWESILQKQTNYSILGKSIIETAGAVIISFLHQARMWAHQSPLKEQH